MNANYTILNREDALVILNATEKRCSARTFGDLEAIEAALKDLLAEKGYAKTCNSKLKGTTAIVGETTGEYMYIEYSKRHSYPNSNQTTFVHLSHNGKGWKLIKAERDYTNKYSRIDTSNTKEAIEAKKASEKAEQERKLAIEEAKKQLAEYVQSRIGSITLADADGVEQTLEAVVKSVIEKEKGYCGLDVRHFDGKWDSKPHTLTVSYKSEELGEKVSATVQLTDESLFCENCENCKWCYFCKDCKDCIECEGCSDCTGCYDCKDCSDCTGCNHCKDCLDCKETSCSYNCANCEKCFGCRLCKDCIDCEVCHLCENCNSCKHCGNFNERVGCKNCERCLYVRSSENCVDLDYHDSFMRGFAH
jgi:hypothetical protein